MQNNASPTELGTQPIGKLIIQYSVPAIIAMTATSLYNIIDSIFIGRGIGSMAIAGLAVTFPLMNLVIAFCTLIATGGATMSSIFLGQRNKERANETLINVTILCIIHSIIFGGITLLYLRPILMFFGATAGTVGYAEDFMQVILFASPISYLFIGLINMMRATGYPKRAMYCALFSVLINVILAPIFIFTFDWGIKGAAGATIVSQTLALAFVIRHFMNKNSFIHFTKGCKLFDSKIVKSMYGIGLSPFIMNVCACIIIIFINKALLITGGEHGELAIGAYGIINRTAMVFVMVVFGVTQGLQPIFGYNYGANNWDRVKEALNKGLIIGGIITTIGFILCEFMPNLITKLYTDDDLLISITNTGFRLSFIFWPLIGIQIIIQNFFQSIGKPKISILLSLSRQMIYLLPLLILFSEWLGIKGVWISMSVADFMAFVTAIIVLAYQFKKLNKRFGVTT